MMTDGPWTGWTAPEGSLERTVRAHIAWSYRREDLVRHGANAPLLRLLDRSSPESAYKAAEQLLALPHDELDRLNAICLNKTEQSA